MVKHVNYSLLNTHPGHVALSVGHLTRKRSRVRYPVWPHILVSLSADSRGAVVSYWRKYVHKVLVNRLGGLSLPRKSVVRLTDRPDMTLDVYRGRKTTTTLNIRYVLIVHPKKETRVQTVHKFTRTDLIIESNWNRLVFFT